MTIKPGAFRFNTDSMKLEIFRGSANYNGTASMAGIGTLAAGQWEEIQATSPEVQTGGTRGLTGGGYAPGTHNEIMFWNIATTGSGDDFGDLTETKGYTTAVSSRTRAVWGGGTNNPASGAVDTLEFVTIASTGNATAFGELNDADRLHMAGAGNQTRGIYAGGETPTRVDIIEYITIASTGDSKDFGNLSSIREAPGGVNSPTRAVFAGGFNPGATLNNIEFVTISTLGNAADFGDLPQLNGGNAGGSNAVRGLFGGGSPGPNAIIDSITIATLGNATRFGDLTVARRYPGCASSSTRCTWVGGVTPSVSNVMDYVEFATEGNAIDFGDLNNANNPGTGSGCSNGHGGL